MKDQRGSFFEERNSCKPESESSSKADLALASPKFFSIVKRLFSFFQRRLKNDLFLIKERKLIYPKDTSVLLLKRGVETSLRKESVLAFSVGEKPFLINLLCLFINKEERDSLLDTRSF